MNQDHDLSMNELSAIQKSPETPQNSQNNNILNEFLSENQVGSTQLKAKYNYYFTLKNQNQHMINKIKQINMALDQQVKQIDRKIYSQIASQNNNKYKVNKQRSKKLQRKYRQLDEMKKQIEMKTVQKNSLYILQSKIQKLKAEYKEKYLEMQQIMHTLQKLRKLITKKQRQEQLTNNSTSTGYNTEVDLQNQYRELKQKIKRQNNRINSQRQKFIDNNKGRHRRNKSTLDVMHLSPINQQKHQQQQYMSPIVLQLKKNYENIGKRIQLLKIQKLTLMNKNDHQDKKRYLQHLKMKSSELAKLVKN